MQVDEEDGPPDDNGDNDHDEDGNKGGRPALISFAEHFKALMGFSQKFGHCNVPQRKSGEYQSLGVLCGAIT